MGQPEHLCGAAIRYPKFVNALESLQAVHQKRPVTVGPFDSSQCDEMRS